MECLKIWINVWYLPLHCMTHPFRWQYFNTPRCMCLITCFAYREASCMCAVIMASIFRHFGRRSLRISRSLRQELQYDPCSSAQRSSYEFKLFHFDRKLEGSILFEFPPSIFLVFMDCNVSSFWKLFTRVINQLYCDRV
jgi:hypothetical protein